MPKTLTDAGIKRLLAACELHRAVCDGSCDVLGARMGWCPEVWSALAKPAGRGR